MKFGLGLITSAVALCAAPIQARVYMVDDADQLVAAVAASNESAEADLIEMSPGLYVLDAGSNGGESGLPVISGDLRIRGNDSEIRRYDQRNYELIQVSESGRLHLDAVTLAEGSAGAMTNYGTIVLRHVRIVDHSTAKRGDAVILNHGSLQLNDVVIGYNLVDAAGKLAGVLVNHGSVELVDTQFVDNRVSTRHPQATIACALINHGRAQLLRVAVSGCLAEQLNLDSPPKVVLNSESGSLLIENLVAEAVHVQLYGSPLTAAVD